MNEITKNKILSANPSLEIANIRDADLREADLRGANLRRTDLRGANLGDANLVGANLLDANLRRTNLRRTDLRGANLGDANLVGANLLDADLREADLRGANLRDANLRGADLRGANLRDADLGGVRSDILLSVSQIGLEYRIINYNISDDRIYCGCWKGSIKEFEDRVEKVYGEVDRYYTEYNAAILYFRMISEYRKNAGIVKIAE